MLLTYILLGIISFEIITFVYKLGRTKELKLLKESFSNFKVDLKLDDSIYESLKALVLAATVHGDTLNRIEIDIKNIMTEDIMQELIEAPYTPPQNKPLKDYIYHLQYTKDKFAKTKVEKETIDKIISNIEKKYERENNK